MADLFGDERPVSGLDRIVFFSDAVMAIAITLIVVQIGIPRVREEDIGKALVDGWPEYLSFLLSFLVIGLYWRWHHIMFRAIVRYDNLFIWLNLAFLVCVAFLPFPTGVIGEYGAQSSAVIAYAATIAMTGITSASMWWYATQGRRLVSAQIPDDQIAFLRNRSLVNPLVFATSIPIAIVDADAAKYFWILAFVIGRFMERGYRGRQVPRG